MVECVVEIYSKRLIHSVVGKLGDQVSFPKVFIQLMINKHVSVFKAITGVLPSMSSIGDMERKYFILVLMMPLTKLLSTRDLQEMHIHLLTDWNF